MDGYKLQVIRLVLVERGGEKTIWIENGWKWMRRFFKCCTFSWNLWCEKGPSICIFSFTQNENMNGHSTDVDDQQFSLFLPLSNSIFGFALLELICLKVSRSHLSALMVVQEHTVELNYVMLDVKVEESELRGCFSLSTRYSSSPLTRWYAS